MRPGVHVDALDGLGVRSRARIGRAHVGSLEPRCPGGLRELRPELAERAQLRPPIDEAGCRGVPERGGPAVAEHDLVAVGEGEEVGDAGADATDELLHGRLAVRCAEQARPLRLEVRELLGTDLRRAAAESTVGGQEVAGDHEARHATSLATGPRPLGWMTGCDREGFW